MNLKNLLEQLTNTIMVSVQTHAPDGQIRRRDMGLIVVSSAVGFAAALGCTKQELEENWADIMKMFGKNEAASVQARRSILHAVDGGRLETPETPETPETSGTPLLEPS